MTTIIDTNMSCILLPVGEFPEVEDAEAKYQQSLPVKSVINRRPLPTYELFCFGGLKRSKKKDRVPIRSISHVTISPLTGSGLWKTIEWPEARVLAGTAQIGHKVFVLGGFPDRVGGKLTVIMHSDRLEYNDESPSTKMEVFDCVQRTWTTLGPCPAGIAFPAMAALDGHIYVAAGSANRLPLSKTWRYCLATDQWSSLAPMPQWTRLQTFPVMVALNSELYIVGDQEGRLACKYCPATDQWSAIARSRYRHRTCSAVAHDGMIYLLSTKGFERYKPKGDLWQKRKPLCDDTDGRKMSDFAGQLVVAGNRLLVLGACLDDDETSSKKVMEYVIKKNRTLLDSFTALILSVIDIEMVQFCL